MERAQMLKMGTNWKTAFGDALKNYLTLYEGFSFQAKGQSRLLKKGSG